MRPKLGFVGLGNIGLPMCRCLLAAGYDVSIYDVDPEAVARLEETSAEPSKNLESLAVETEVILLSLPDSSVVEEVVSGEGGLLTGLSSGKTVIDASSSRPSSTRDLAKTLSDAGVRMLDAPVSGGLLKARDGRLSVMVGGDEETYLRCREILGAFGERVVRVGESGSGHLVKALNNMLSATTLLSAVEAVVFAKKAGIDPETFLAVINAGNGRSYSTEVKFPEYILDRSFDDGFSLNLMAKDLGVALQAAADAGHPLLTGSLVSQLWQTAASNGYGPKGHTSIYDFIEEFVGGEVQKNHEKGGHNGDA